MHIITTDELINKYDAFNSESDSDVEKLSLYSEFEALSLDYIRQEINFTNYSQAREVYNRAWNRGDCRSSSEFINRLDDIICFLSRFNQASMEYRLN